MLIAGGVYYLNQVADDKSTYWAANAALAQMRGDYNAPPATAAGIAPGGPPATSGHPTRGDMDWAACSAALKTIGTGDGQPDVALAAALGGGGSAKGGGAGAGAGGGAGAAVASLSVPDGPQAFSFDLDPRVHPEAFDALYKLESKTPLPPNRKVMLTHVPAEAKKVQFHVQYDTRTPEGQALRAELEDISKRYPSSVPAPAKPTPAPPPALLAVDFWPTEVAPAQTPDRTSVVAFRTGSGLPLDARGGLRLPTRSIARGYRFGVYVYEYTTRSADDDGEFVVAATTLPVAITQRLAKLTRLSAPDAE
jgi:hypothetical protein